jgi:hypothetical protein
MVDIATGQVPDMVDDGRNAAAVELERRGGLKGGKVRARTLTPERPKEIALNAAAKRWKTD